MKNNADRMAKAQKICREINTKEYERKQKEATEREQKRQEKLEKAAAKKHFSFHV